MVLYISLSLSNNNIVINFRTFLPVEIDLHYTLKYYITSINIKLITLKIARQEGSIGLK